MSILMSRSNLGAVVVGLSLALAAPARSDDQDWPMFGRDPLGTRYNTAEKRLGPANVAGLKVLWRQPTPAIVAGTPAVVGGSVFDGDAAGNFYALDAATGALRWKTAIAGASFTASPIVLQGRVVIGDMSRGTIYGLDKSTGTVVWNIRPNSFGRPAIWGSGTQVGQFVAIGVASNNDGQWPSRGSLVLLDPTDGRVIWQTFTISPAEAAAGASGATIWTTPAFDAESNMIYAGTGNNGSEPTTGTSDAIIAFDANTGAIRWVNQRTPNDASPPDFDFADSPQLYRLPNGRKVVGEGQKSGFYHVLDAATGAVVNFRQFLPGGIGGGLFTDSAVADGMVFAPGNNFMTGSCALIAIKGNGSGEQWRFVTSGPEANGVAVANGVVYFKPSSDPHLYAFDMAGNRLAAVSVGGSNSGVAVSRGRVFLGLGNAYSNGLQAPGGIIALGP